MYKRTASPLFPNIFGLLLHERYFWSLRHPANPLYEQRAKEQFDLLTTSAQSCHVMRDENPITFASLALLAAESVRVEIMFTCSCTSAAAVSVKTPAGCKSAQSGIRVAAKSPRDAKGEAKGSSVWILWCKF